MAVGEITVSIVSHGHGIMVAGLVDQLRIYPQISRIVLTLNVPEVVPVASDNIVRVIYNTSPKGFGANHNAAFSYCDTPYFCVLNPDVTLSCNPFAGLLEGMAQRQADLVAPLIFSPIGEIEDSVRSFPTFWSLAGKMFGGDGGRYRLEPGRQPFFANWVAGMFMVFRSEAYDALSGFDEKFFLYYEDVDICARAWKAGMRVIACPSVSVIHDAQRASHRNLRYLRWHLASMVRYFLKHWGRLPKVPVLP